ncbi:MAG: hypothetical protein LBT54_04105, partial [Bifidobacteriaceae bacterium]|nr:hypothetical protein [Bifidobacteriaceae bacterium]
GSALVVARGLARWVARAPLAWVWRVRAGVARCVWVVWPVRGLARVVSVAWVRPGPVSGPGLGLGRAALAWRAVARPVGGVRV